MPAPFDLRKFQEFLKEDIFPVAEVVDIQLEPVTQYSVRLEAPQWCADNCSAKFRRSRPGKGMILKFEFESPTDAVHFKLTWG